MENKRFISPIIFLANLVNPFTDGWTAMEKYLGFRLDFDGYRRISDPDMIGAIGCFSVTTDPSVNYPTRENFMTWHPEFYLEKALLKYTDPAKIHLKIPGLLPIWLIPEDILPKVKRRGNCADLGSAIQNADTKTRNEYAVFHESWAGCLAEIYGDRLAFVDVGYETSVAGIWPLDQKTFVEFVSAPIYRGLKNAGSKALVIGFCDTMQGDQKNASTRKNSWRSAYLEWIYAGGLNACDRIGIHLYQSEAAEYRMNDLIEENFTIIDDLGISKTHTDGLYLTETGFSAWTEKKTLGFKCGMKIIVEQQADRWRRLIEYFQKQKRIALISAYAFWMPGNDDPYGILNPGYSPRQAFNILRRFWIEQKNMRKE